VLLEPLPRHAHRERQARWGLAGMHEPRKPTAHHTQPVDLGRCRLPNVDDVASALPPPKVKDTVEAR
jgi:hypothetical protein